LFNDEQKTTAYEWIKKMSNFYWQATKQMYQNVKKARNLRRDIAFRTFRRADRRETMFLNQVTIDLVKVIPVGTIGMLPGGTVTLPLLAWLLPTAMPSVYLTPEYIIKSRQKHYEIRKEHSTVIIDLFKKELESLATTDPKDISEILLIFEKQESIEQTLSRLERFDNYPMFEKLSITSIDNTLVKSMTKFLLVTRHEAYGISGVQRRQVNAALAGSGSGSLYLPVIQYSIMAWADTNFAFKWVRVKAIRDYLEQVRNDDLYIRYFSVANMSPKELSQALYMRGFNIQDKKGLETVMTTWIQFSTQVKSESLKILALALVWKYADQYKE
jgi:hypothetical protein